MDINITQLAHDIAQSLFSSSTLLAALREAGKGASSEIGKKLIGATADKTKALLEKLWPEIEANPPALEAVKDVALAPADDGTRSLFQLQLKKLLAEDEPLAKEIAHLFEEAKSSGEVKVIQSGHGNVYVGGDVFGSVNTGDNKS